MPAFAAINLDPEEIITEEIDNTKELQVDDALKQFQTALKLHAQGPRFFDEAADAYNALFECDIFKYPESKTEYERAEISADGLNPLEPTFLSGIEAGGVDGDNLGATLLQAYYLSYKNHGQYILDCIKHRARTTSAPDSAAVFEDAEVLDSAKTAVDDFTAALDRDPSDAELWRRTARVAAFLKSARINRYALEAAIELDDDPAVVEVDPPSLAEGFAGEQLKMQLDVLSDHLALTHPIMKPFISKEIPRMLQPYVDPVPYLPNPTIRLANSNLGAEKVSFQRLTVEVKSLSWTELGTSLLFCLAENGTAGQAVSIQLPHVSDEEAAEQMEIDKQLQIAQDTVMQIDPAEGSPAQERKASIAEAPTSPKAPRKERSISLPSRKRSQSMAGLPEAQDDDNADTKRSKRARRRDTAAEENIDPATLLATQLQPYQAADQNLFQTTKNILENLGVTETATLNRISEILDTCATEDRTARVTDTATVDLRDCIVSFDEGAAEIFLNKKETPQPGLSTFHEHTSTGSKRALEPPAFDEGQDLRTFVRNVNEEWLTLEDVAYLWAKALSKTYASCKWSDRTKTAVVHIISRFDKAIYERINYELQQCDRHMENEAVPELDILVQTLFELHLDVYERITNPTSTVEQSIRLDTKGRLDRWFDIAAKMRRTNQREVNDLVLRFVWAAVSTTTFAEGVTRDHVLILWHSLRNYLAEAGHAPIHLPNNVVMPEISSSAADREISKLTTMDFFLGLFQEEIGEPVAIIEMLEPVLNPETVLVEQPADNVMRGTVDGGADGDGGDAGSHEDARKPISEIANQGLRDLWKFLENSSTDLRLFLWTRLAGAYATINYTTKQFSCFLRALEMIVTDLEQEGYINTPAELRKTVLMTMLKSADDLLVPALTLALNDNSAFDIVDEAHLRSTIAALSKLSCLLHVAFMYEDEVKIGLTQPPATNSTFSSFLNKLREMQVRNWSLQYTMLKVGINQNPDVFPRPENDLADYLAAVHQVLGLRKCCKGSNRTFLKMMRAELLKQHNIDNWEDYLGQVLYDMYGIKLGVGMWEVQDHGCPPEKLEKRAAMGLVEKITTMANRMSIKDLLKSDLKAAIDHMQQAIGSTKSTPQMIHNLRNFTEYMKKPIHPLRLYQAMTGKVSLDAVTVNTPESALARHGWFFLLGMLAFTKFKAVDLNRRQTPGATDDLRLTATYLRLQLQFTPNHWNAWFRLAESFDYEVEEAVLWTADKMNKDRDELVKYQRNAIHCYTLALSYSRSWETDSPAAVSSVEDDEVLSEMYYSFGMRLYASSREPFAMEAFQHADQERFFINMDPSQAAGTFRKILHEQMSDYKVWKFAASLFRRAMAGRPKDWKNPYMYAKCLWKMYQKPKEELDQNDQRSRPTVQAVVAALERSVQVVTAQQKPRQDPILEPHYKILSVMHKLVMRKEVGQQEAVDILQRQPFALQRGEKVILNDNDDWEAYVIKCLRVLRDKDKSNWQHRLIMRHAQILFDPEPPSRSSDSSSDLRGEADHEQDGADLVSAKAAFSVLRENMFTKTMVMNVWKCDAERPGRHHVYTSQYVRYMFRLLSVMNDRPNMEALLRRLRKKGADFYHFNDLWYGCALTYLTLIRHSYKIPAAADDAFKHLSPEEFDIVAERINEWVIGPAAQDHPALGALKDSIELKKLNGGLMKSALIDDLIADCYSHLYTEINSTLPGPDPAKVVEERQKARDAELQANDLKSALTSGLLLPHAEKDGTPVGSGRASAEPPEKQEGVTRSRRSAVVRKPDILRKAEQAVSRALEGPPKAAGKTRLGSLSGGKNNTPNGDGSGDEQAEDVEMKDGDQVGDENGQGKEGSSSPPGSIHDSADDESDLSDVPPDYEDDAPPPPSLLFPNLRRSMDTSIVSPPQSEEETTSDEEDDDEEDENGDEDDTRDEAGKEPAHEEQGKKEPVAGPKAEDLILDRKIQHDDEVAVRAEEPQAMEE